MKRLYIKCLLLTLTAIFLSAGFLFAQDPLKLDLKLNHGSVPTPMPRSGEFSLSLDSQLFDRTISGRKLADIELEKPNTNLTNIDEMNFSQQDPDPEEQVTEDASPELQLITSQLPHDHNFTSTLTLTTGYHDNSMNLLNDQNEGLVLEKKLGKFKILGKFEQRRITRIPIPESPGQSGFTANAKNTFTRASLDNNTQNNTSDPKSKSSSLASRYFLEAIYSFKPTVQGKLSYNRSMIDTIESKEKLQFEGTLEANRNILIKAGYDNETRPEVNEPKATTDNKVWTEFILKF